MFHADGTMLARYPHVDELIGKKFKSAPLMNSVLSQGGLQTLRVKSPVDGQDRLGSAAPLTPFPDRRGRDQHGRGRARRLARANPLPDRRRGAVGRW